MLKDCFGAHRLQGRPDRQRHDYGEELDRPDGVWRIGDRVVSAEEGKGAFREALKAGRPKVLVTKIPMTIRLDPEVLDWFKSQGRGYQTRINDLFAGSQAPASRLLPCRADLY